MSLRKHKEIWRWHSENPGAKTRDWPGWKDIENIPPEYDPMYFACQAATSKCTDLSSNRCKMCPLMWSNKEHICCAVYHTTLYEIWIDCNSWARYATSPFPRWLGRFLARIIAKRIQNCPVKEEWKNHPDWNPNF